MFTAKGVWGEKKNDNKYFKDLSVERAKIKFPNQHPKFRDKRI
jgi:hypothetical protein